jgi:hypothetical protein
MNRTILIAACLLAAMPALGAGLFGGPPEPGKMPSRFVRFEGLADGPCFVNGPPLLMGRLAGVTVMLNRVRFGAALDEGYAEFDGWSGDMMLPLHVGYTLLSRPKKTLLFYGAVPEIYAEASGSLWGPMLAFEFEPALRVALCCDVDYGGVGARFEMGWADIKRHYDASRTSRTPFIYAGLQVRLLAFGIGF